MPSHKEIRHSPHTIQELYALVVDIERYPEFLPWVAASRILQREGEEITADLVVRFNAFTETFTSKVIAPPVEEGKMARVDVALVEGPFHHLENHWEFHPTPEGGTEIHFFIDFTFRTRIFESMVGFLFEKALKKMVSAFEERANALYGARE